MQGDIYTGRREGWTRLPGLGKDNLSPLLYEIKRLYLLFFIPTSPGKSDALFTLYETHPFRTQR